MKIVADQHIPFIKEYFAGYGKLVLKAGRAINADDVKDADILIVRSITHVGEELLKHSKVKFVGSVTAGADHLEVAWLNQVGIAWSNANGFNAPPVADYVVSVVAALTRKGLLHQRRRAAVIGAGHVGKLVIERLNILGFDVLISDPVRAVTEKNFHSVPLQELTDLDLISLHVPLTRHNEHPTYHFIDKDFFARQKLGCVLINASRGAVINTNQLMTEGSHLHWCLDVWEQEPNINKQILEHAIISTPHIAGYSLQSKIRGIDMIYRVLCDLGIIQAQPRSPITMPKQQLVFAGENHHWHDVILGIFNPMVMTQDEHELY